MLEYDMTDISKAINVNKTNTLKNVIFVIIGVFQVKVLNMNHICNGCDDLIQKAMNVQEKL